MERLSPYNWRLFPLLVLSVCIGFSTFSQVVVVGTGQFSSTNQQTTPFANFYEDSRHQYLYTANELTSGGAVQGSIVELAFEVSLSHSHLTPAFQVGLKQITSSALLTSAFDTGFNTVYNDTVLVNSAGWYPLDLTTPFVWDGTSNLLLEVCFDNSTFTGNAGVYYSNTTFGSNRYVFADNASGCSLASFNVINERPNLRFTIQPNDPTGINGASKVCLGDSVQLTATGAIGQPVWYIDGCDSTMIDTGNSVWVSPGQTTTYHVANQVGGILSQSCAQVTVEVIDPLLSLTVTPAICIGDSNGVATSVVSGALLPYTFLWSDGDTQSVRSSLPAGSYSVTLTDSLGCEATANGTITELFALPIVHLGNDTTVCDSLTLSLGPGFTGFLWSDLSTGNTFTTQGAGMFWVTATDTNTCSNRDTIEVFNFSPLSVSVNTTTAACGISNGTAGINVNIGPGGYNYLWSNGDSTNLADSLPAGNHMVSITDTNGCVFDTTVAVLNGGAHTLNMFVQPVTCFGGNDGKAWLSVNGGTAPFTFLWNDANLQTTDTAYSLSAGVYSVTVTDINLCIAFDSITVGNGFALPQPNLGNDTSLCIGDSLQLMPGSFSSYQWGGGSVQDSVVVNSQGSYSVLVTDTHGCQNTDTIHVNFTALPIVNLGLDTSICPGDSLVLFAGSGFQYGWSDSSSTDSLLVTDSGQFWVRITDVNLCQSSDTFLLALWPQPELSLPDDTTVCDGESIVLNPSGTWNSYFWSDTSTADTLQANSAASYWLEVTDSNQCSTRDTFELMLYPLPHVDLGPDKDTLCQPFTYTLVVNNHQGYTYLWNTGSSDTALVTDSGGIYWLQVTSSDGCQFTDTIQLVEDPCVGLAENPTNPEIRLFPNPTNGNLNIDAPGISDFTAEVWSMYGSLLIQKAFPVSKEENHALNLSGLPAGTYVITLRGIDFLQSFRIVRL